ncbi:BrnA antitoxin family protein, partial [Candidatus Igneacidithiobacillus taiwanensis]|uniref:BrnA antitoxin family protein n=1 Tax=Candidatus Igneacidithiobacillus taiwanensis TaxID=1945924 RepID=UPI00289CFAA7
MHANKPATKPTWNDPDDAPELSDAWFAQADLYHGDKLVRRGRPKAAITKIHTGIRLDADVLA